MLLHFNCFSASSESQSDLQYFCNGCLFDITKPYIYCKPLTFMFYQHWIYLKSSFIQSNPQTYPSFVFSRLSYFLSHMLVINPLLSKMVLPNSFLLFWKVYQFVLVFDLQLIVHSKYLITSVNQSWLLL